MKIVTKRLVLRDLRKSDASSIVEYAGNLNVTRHLLVVPHPYSIKDAKKFITASMKSAKVKKRKGYSLGITLKGTDKVIGVISLSDVDLFQGTGTIGYCLAEEHWRKGYMTEALTAMIDFAFKKLSLRRLDVCAFTENEASNALIRKFGFTHEGTMRKNVRCKATKKVHDEHIYGLLKEEWQRKKP
jgi:ribosomal-protein-alanine N-acetyltransferase